MTTNLEERAREQFEAWWWTRHADYTPELLKRTSKAGAYDSNWVNGMWLAWQAASTHVQVEARLRALEEAAQWLEANHRDDEDEQWEACCNLPEKIRSL